MISLLSDAHSNFYDSAVTQIKILSPEWKLTGKGLFFMGSCFADYLYSEYSSAGLNAAASPFGNIYNPETLAEAAKMLMNSDTAIKPEDCFNIGSNENPQYRHFMFHSLITSNSAEKLSEELIKGISAARTYIKKAEAAVITLGTAWVFRKKNGFTVNNCHKKPAAEFTRTLLNVEEASDAVGRMTASLRSINSDIKIIISLSPVRHLRDNAAENSLSKSVLRCAIDSACKSLENIWYYPSYEIMLDELRDYRWYADDLCHPSGKAVSYIISRFMDSIYGEEFKDFMKKYSPVLRDLHHRAFNPESAEYLKFRKNAETRYKNLAAEYPGLLFEEPVSF